MVSFDAFYQQLDSEEAIKLHRQPLIDDAREVLQEHPEARIGGAITLAGSPEGQRLRELVRQHGGEVIPPDKHMVTIIPLHEFDHLLDTKSGRVKWTAPQWTGRQSHLPVFIATRDGLRFAVLGLWSEDEMAAE